MVAELELELAQDLEQNAVGTESTARALPFAFAKRHGVLLQGVQEGRPVAIYRRGASPQSLAEVRRFIGGPISFSPVEAESFDERLQSAYESGAAMTMMEGLDDETDLLEVAQQLPEPSDLLESDDADQPLDAALSVNDLSRLSIYGTPT